MSDTTPSRALTGNEIAIIGMAGRFPRADGLDAFWQNLRNGVEGTSKITPEDLRAIGVDPAVLNDPDYVSEVFALEEAEHFDAEFFGFTPREAEMMDPQQRVFLETAWAALEHAGYDSARYEGLVGVFGGVGYNSYFTSALASRPELFNSVGQYPTLIGNERDFPTTHVSYRLNLRGPSVDVQSACSTSGAAVHLACQALRYGDCDIALAGGCKVIMPNRQGYWYIEGGPLAPEGHIRAFDADAKGMVRGSGAAIVVLKRLEDALADGDTIHGVVLGSAINNDGAGKIGFTAPSVAGQAAVISEALAAAGVTADAISYVETHGTGTVLGDPIEVAGLTEAFRRTTDRTGFCAIGSVKTNIGHLDAGATAAGIVKTALALRHELLPPSLNFRRPNPQIDFASSPFYVNARLTPWPRGAEPRRAGVSSFGLGGTNVHVVIEEAPVVQPSGPGRPHHLLLLSAKSETALDAATDRLARHLRQEPEQSLADVAYTLQVGRRQWEHRRVLVSDGVEDAASALEGRDARRLITQRGAGATPTLVYMFAGGGAQYPGMAAGLMTEPTFREAVEECADVLDAEGRAALRALLQAREPGQGVEPELERPSVALPALFAVEYALGRLWASWGLEPAAMIGHSMGEYTAACLSGVFSLEDALRLVVCRGHLFERLPEGGMLSVPLSEAELRPWLDDRLCIAAINKPSLCVASGATEAIDELAARLDEQGIDSTRIHISVAAHSHLVEPILEEFSGVASQIRFSRPAIPFVSNVSGTWITDAEATSPAYWVRHLRQTVRFADGLDTLFQEPGRVLLEVGPGQTLSTFARQHPACAAVSSVISSVRHPQERVDDCQFLMQALGRLWLTGLSVDWEAFHAPQRRHRVPLPTYPFQRKRHSLLDGAGAAHARSTAPPATVAEPVTDAPSVVPAPTVELPFSPVEMTPMAAPAVVEGTSAPRRDRIVAELQKIIQELSGMGVEKIDVNATFLELGFDSLFLAQANSAFKKRFKIKLTTRQLLEKTPTITALAEHLDAELPMDAFPAPATAPTRAVAPMPAVLAAVPASAAAAQVPSGAMPPLTAIPSGMGSPLEAVIAQQLQLMQAQLAALRGAPVSAMAAAVAAAPVAATAAAPVASPVPAPAEAPAVPDKTSPWQPVAKTADGEVTRVQQEHLDALIARVTARTPKSKALTQTHRPHLSDPRTVQGFRKQWKEMVYPLVSERAEGSRIWDIDGNEYIDLVNGYGVNFFGHSPKFILDAVREQLDKTVAIGPQTPLAGDVAKLVCELTGMERAAFCNTGSEAVLAAIRMARTVTGKTRLASFAGHYHGIFDEVLIKGTGTGAERRPLPTAPGIPRKAVEDALVLEYGNFDSLEVIRKHADELALVLVEPVRSRNLDLQPREFLQALRKVTAECGIPLLFDEMITGFRSHPGGAQAIFGVRADLATYGKVIGGEFPIGVVAGKKEYLDALDGGFWAYGDSSTPEADMTWFAGTFVRHPVALSAARAVLRYLKDQGPQLQENLNRRTAAFVKDLNDHFKATNAPIWIEQFASIFIVTFTSYQEYSPLLFYHLHNRGIYTYEGRPAFFTLAHTDEDMERVAVAFKEAVAELQNVGLFSGGPVRKPGEAFEVPLTEGQQEIWIATRFGDEASSAFNLSIKLLARGALDVSAMRTALQGLVDRHEALRTTFADDGERQQIKPALTLDIPVVDLTAVPEAERDAAADALELKEAKTPYDLEAGPLVRARIVKLADDRWRVLFLVHHIVADGWACGVLSRDLGRLYSAARKGTKPDLKPLMQLSEYVQFLQSDEEREAQQASEQFWLQEYATVPQPLNLPTDRPRPPVKTYPADRIFLRLDATLVGRLKQAAAHQGATLFALGFAAFDAFLHRLTGQDDLVVGFDLAGQALVPGRDLVSHCVSFLPLRMQVDGRRPFTDLVAAMRGKLFDVMENQHFTYGALLKKVRVPPDPSRLPLVSVSFNLDPSSLGVEFDGLEVVSDSIPRQFENNDLFVNLVQLDDGGIELQCTYNKELFDRETARRRMEEFVTLLGDAAERPDTPIAQLETMPPEERELVVAGWNATAAEVPENATLHGLVAAQAARTPDARAVVAEAGVAPELTFAELERRANALAVLLQHAGVTRDTPVAVAMERSAELVVALLAVLKSGGAYVPVDPAYPEQRRAFMIEDSGALVVLTQARLRATLPDGPTVLAVDEIWPELEEGTPEERATSESLAYIIYTSGSTGTPKGAMIEHRSIVNRLLWQHGYLGLQADDVVLQKTPYSFDVSVWEFFSPLLAGATLVMARPEGHKDPAYLVEAIRRHGVTTVHFVPSMLQAFLGEAEAGTCVSLRRVVCSGEALSPVLRDRFFEALPVELYNLYGPTEAAVDVSATRCVRGSPSWTVPIGRPVANTRLYVLDDRLRPVPIGVPGELYIAGLQVGRGYLNRPDLTAERFLEDPFVRNGARRLYRTGDLCRFLPDGQIEYLGRLDHQVKIRGFRIELGEIETALEALGGVRQAVVAVKEVTPGDQALVAYLTSENGGSPDTASLRAALARSLPEYMIPQHWVTLPEMPLTASGKVDRKALPAPERTVRAGEEHVAPSTEVQRQLAAIWQEVLSVPRVGVTDNFFDLGGHSILATRVVSRIRRDLAVELPLRKLFTGPTLGQLAEEVEALIAAAALGAVDAAAEPLEAEVVL
jgi:amino acid adenylation domain-containing protein